jgi:diacylglycerol kinase (ATP)
VSSQRSPTIFDSFNYAAEGIIHVLRTQRNMRIHFLAAVIVLVTALVISVSKLELIALLLAIAFVFITEMVNSAIEQAIDVATTSFDPLAKLAKDVAAGAVLIATINAVAIGYLVFSGQVSDTSSRLLDRLRDAPAQVTLIALVLTIIVVLGTKAYTGRGTPLRGGLPSGHAAVAFAGWMAATYIVSDTHRFLISSLTFIMALLVAQTRVESGVHSALEVAYGGVLGALVTLVVFQVLACATSCTSGLLPLLNVRTRPTRTTSSGRRCARGTGGCSRA